MLLSGLWMWKGHVPRRPYFEEIGLTTRCGETVLILPRGNYKKVFG